MKIYTNVTFSPANKCHINSGITSRPFSGINLTFTSGTFEMGSSGHVDCALIMENNVTLDFRAMSGNNFNGTLNITSGTTTLRGSNKLLPKDLTINNGAVFFVQDTILYFGGAQLWND